MRRKANPEVEARKLRFAVIHALGSLPEGEVRETILAALSDWREMVEYDRHVRRGAFRQAQEESK